MKDLKWSEGELGRKSGVPQPTIHRILTGVSASPRHNNVEKIAKALGVTSEWLWKGSDTAERFQMASSGARDEGYTAGLVPLISWEQAANWVGHPAPEPFQEPEAWLPCPVPHSATTFALRVRGLSMFNPRERRSFQDGDVIFVDPARLPEHASFVIAKLGNSQEATFRQLVVEGERHFLKPVNDSWPDPILELTEHARICGVAVCKVEIF
ncbi:LexA family protein [Pseudomonas farsensis]|uniref:S24 family peptidase n=1 Tax=Pseudomonas farsensis TaxID=2745492 RepID=A0ABU8QLX1_9PSED